MHEVDLSSAAGGQERLRPDLQLIADWIRPNTRVLDLGCGRGSLLKNLQSKKQVDGVGVEINNEKVIACVQNGVNVIQQNLEDGLALFADKQFDTVVLSQTLQAVLQTEHILKEMSRVADYGVVSFPNFGHWSHWWSILKGRMPVTGQMPYEWYNTPNVHLCTMADFEDLAHSLEFEIIQRHTFANGRRISFLPNWRSTLILYFFKT